MPFICANYTTLSLFCKQIRNTFLNCMCQVEMGENIDTGNILCHSILTARKT